MPTAMSLCTSELTQPADCPFQLAKTGDGFDELSEIAQIVSFGERYAGDGGQANDLRTEWP